MPRRRGKVIRAQGEAVMPDEQPMPSDCAPIEALDPNTGKTRHLYVRQAKIQATAKRGMGPARELAYVVPWAVQNPSAIFRGVREEGESQWLCFVARPQDAYDYKTGERRAPWLGQVFLVFVDDDRIIYNWRWDKADLNQPDLPLDYVDRFEERLL
jgi:hypothetical protein